uniref:dihydrolipoyllysine-residue succinyltransferase n=1 Tax=Albugo laibachii Nc14 TaxID=890382 RepID=F0WKC6_9STRA|nr:unnamed protein product [Albugo laibachii Nc14]|eukprot:CCA21730.1 unnamed protein product [Albugo laibachii Nc14]
MGDSHLGRDDCDDSGDYAKAEEPVIVIETDKVSVDVYATFADELVGLIAKPDDLVQEDSKVFIREKPPSKLEDYTTSTSPIPTHSADNLDRSTLKKAPDILYSDYVVINVAINVAIDVAVAASNGVVVPVIRNVENILILALEKSLHALRMDGENDLLAIGDSTGGTFTILDAGIYDALRPAVVHEEIVPCPMMLLSLTYDHRIIEGREGVTFLKSIDEGISDPRRTLLQLNRGHLRVGKTNAGQFKCSDYG